MCVYVIAKLVGGPTKCSIWLHPILLIWWLVGKFTLKQVHSTTLPIPYHVVRLKMFDKETDSCYIVTIYYDSVPTNQSRPTFIVSGVPVGRFKAFNAMVCAPNP